jgi:hypothetical protein
MSDTKVTDTIAELSLARPCDANTTAASMAVDAMRLARPTLSVVERERIKIWCNETWDDYPDTTVRAIAAVIRDFNATDHVVAPRRKDALGAQLVLLCTLYLAHADLARKRHERVSRVTTEQQWAITRFLTPEKRPLEMEDVIVLRKIVGLEPWKDDAELTRVFDAHVAEAERTLWVLDKT